MADEIGEPAEEPTPEGPAGESEQDTEGHFLPNLVVSHHLAAQRERDIQRDLQRHEREVEARRPHRKEGHR